MTLTQLLFTYLYPLIVGMGLGLIYFGGLWLTLRTLSDANHRKAWLVSLSLLGRMSIVAAVLYLLFRDSWQQLLAVMAGMLITRTLLVRRIRPAPRSQSDEHGATS